MSLLLLIYDGRTLQSSHLNFCFQIHRLTWHKSRISLFFLEDCIDTESGLTTYGTKGTSTTVWAGVINIWPTSRKTHYPKQIYCCFTRCTNERNPMTEFNGVDDQLIGISSVPVCQYSNLALCLARRMHFSSSDPLANSFDRYLLNKSQLAAHLSANLISLLHFFMSESRSSR